MKKEPVSRKAIRRDLLLGVKIKLEKSLARINVKVKQKSDMLKLHDPSRHTKISGRNKRIACEVCCEKRDMIEVQIQECLLMISELGD